MITNDYQCKGQSIFVQQHTALAPHLLLSIFEPSFTQQSPWSFPCAMVDLRSRRRCCDVLANREMNGMCCRLLLHLKCHLCKKIAPLCILGAPQVLLASKGSISKVRSNNTCKRNECIFKPLLRIDVYLLFTVKQIKHTLCIFVQEKDWEVEMVPGGSKKTYEFSELVSFTSKLGHAFLKKYNWK